MDYETYLFQPEFAGRYLRPTGEGGYVGGPRGGGSCRGTAEGELRMPQRLPAKEFVFMRLGDSEEYRSPPQADFFL